MNVSNSEVAEKRMVLESAKLQYRMSYHYLMTATFDLIRLMRKRKKLNTMRLNDFLINHGYPLEHMAKRYATVYYELTQKGFTLEEFVRITAKDIKAVSLYRFMYAVLRLEKESLLEGIEALGLKKFVEMYGVGKHEDKGLIKGNYPVLANLKDFDTSITKVSDESDISKLQGYDVPKYALLKRGELYCISVPCESLSSYVAAEKVKKTKGISKTVIYSKKLMLSCPRAYLGAIHIEKARRIILKEFTEIKKALSSSEGILMQCKKCKKWMAKENFPYTRHIKKEKQRRKVFCPTCRDYKKLKEKQNVK